MFLLLEFLLLNCQSQSPPLHQFFIFYFLYCCFFFSLSLSPSPSQPIYSTSNINIQHMISLMCQYQINTLNLCSVFWPKWNK